MSIIETLTNRPTETVTGIALAGTVYGFLTQVGLDPVLAAVIAIVVAFGPAAVSATVDSIRGTK